MMKSGHFTVVALGLISLLSVATSFVLSPSYIPTTSPSSKRAASSSLVLLPGGFLDDLFGNDKKKEQTSSVSKRTDQEEEDTSCDSDSLNDDSLSLAAFQQEVSKRETTPPPQQQNDDDDEEFDGYVMRDIIVEKWGEAFDLEFQRVEAMGFKEIYLNVMPFRLGSKNFRHASELDYLCHLQAVVEILLKYNQVGNILYQIDVTNKKPRAGTSPLLAVPLKLDLTPEQVDKILGP